MVGHIILKREFLEWEWYQHPTVFRIYLHIMLRANFKSKRWMGKSIQRGQLVTSANSLAIELALSEQQIRTGLKKLEEGGHIIKEATNSYTLLTISNYDSYQSAKNYDNMPGNTPVTFEQQTNNIPITTTKESNKEKKEKSKPLELRKQTFINEVISFSDFDKCDLDDFIGYWSELNPAKTQMRFEKDEFFEIEKRLKKWVSNKKNFQKSTSTSNNSTKTFASNR